MKTALRIVVLEDAISDVVLINRELRKGGLIFRTKRVETKSEFLDELENRPPDLILSDHGVPAFDGFSALALKRERWPDIPFIFVTGSQDESLAARACEHGATDFVLKSHLFNLVPAVRRAIGDAEAVLLRRRMEAERDRLQKELQSALNRIDKLRGLLPVCGACGAKRADDAYWRAVEEYLRQNPEAHFGDRTCPECADELPRESRAIQDFWRNNVEPLRHRSKTPLH